MKTKVIIKLDFDTHAYSRMDDAADDIKRQLQEMFIHALNNGMLTGNTELELAGYDFKVKIKD